MSLLASTAVIKNKPVAVISGVHRKKKKTQNLVKHDSVE